MSGATYKYMADRLTTIEQKLDAIIAAGGVSPAKLLEFQRRVDASEAMTAYHRQVAVEALGVKHVG